MKKYYRSIYLKDLLDFVNILEATPFTNFCTQGLALKTFVGSSGGVKEGNKAELNPVSAQA